MSSATCYDVKFTTYREYRGPSGKPTLLVEYHTSWRRAVREWVPLMHGNRVGDRARLWWRRRTQAPIPRTVAEAAALATNGPFMEPARVHIRRQGQFDRVVNYEFEAKP